MSIMNFITKRKQALIDLVGPRGDGMVSPRYKVHAGHWSISNQFTMIFGLATLPVMANLFTATNLNEWLLLYGLSSALVFMAFAIGMFFWEWLKDSGGNDLSGDSKFDLFHYAIAAWVPLTGIGAFFGFWWLGLAYLAAYAVLYIVLLPQNVAVEGTARFSVAQLRAWARQQSNR